MSNTPTPPTPDMQAAIEAAVNERMAALSGRMDRFEREAFARTVKDGRIDKRIFGQGESLRTHMGDGLAHMYRDQWMDRDILDLERLPEQAAAGDAFTADVATMDTTSSTNYAADYSKILLGNAKETNALVIDADNATSGITVKVAGWYYIDFSVVQRVTVAVDPSGLNDVSFGVKADTSPSSLNMEALHTVWSFFTVSGLLSNVTLAISKPVELQAESTIYLWAKMSTPSSEGTVTLHSASLSLVRLAP